MKRVLFAVAAVAFVLRLGYSAMSGTLRHPQVWEQETIATNLLEGHGFLYKTDRAYAEPLYPFLAAGVYFVTNRNQTALVLVQLIIASATVWITGWAAWIATRRKSIAAIAATIIAVDPGFIRYSSVLHPFVLDSFFFIAAAAMLVRYRQQPTLARGLAAGAIVGLGALTRPTILIFLLPLSCIRLKRSFAVAAIALAMVAPWTIRNALVLHEFVLTRSGAGFVFWLGNNPNSTGSATDALGHPVVKTLPPQVRAHLKQIDEIARDRWFREAAWSYIRSNPPAALWRVMKRLYDFWWFSPQWGVAYSTTLKLIYRLWWGSLLLLIVFGGVVTRNRDVWLIATCAILISLLQSIYYVEGRHRLAVEPLCAPLAAAGVMSAWSQLARSRQQPPLDEELTDDPR